MADGDNEKVSISLKVKMSKIRMGGIARVNSEILPHIEVEKGDMVQVHGPGKNILVKLTADPLIDMDTISLREPDMKKLNVNEGDEVELMAHASIADKLGDLKENILKKFKKSDEEEDEE